MFRLRRARKEDIADLSCEYIAFERLRFQSKAARSSVGRAGRLRPWVRRSATAIEPLTSRAVKRLTRRDLEQPARTVYRTHCQYKHSECPGEGVIHITQSLSLSGFHQFRRLFPERDQGTYRPILRIGLRTMPPLFRYRQWPEWLAEHSTGSRVLELLADAGKGLSRIDGSCPVVIERR